MNGADREALFITMAEEFRVAMHQDVDIVLQGDLTYEEATELCEAAVAMTEIQTIETVTNFLKELADYTYVVAGMVNMYNIYEGHNNDLERALDASGFRVKMDRINNAGQFASMATGDFVTQEQLVEVIKRVHASNMSKLDDDGQPLRREDGKILKGPNYQEPDLNDIAVNVLPEVIIFMED